MLTGANTMEEVQGMIQSREIKYVVLPSWDPFFEDFGKLYLAAQFSNRKSFFVGELRRWNLPLWLRPVAYPMPVIPGFENQSVLLFEVVEEQKSAVALSRLAEYLAETGDLDRAAAVGEELRRFPGDVTALTARAQVQAAKGDAAGLAQSLDPLLSRLANGADRYLAWDRRVSLAIVLARGGRIEPAREQARRCLAEINPPRIRSLSPASLYGLLVLSQSFGLPLPDAGLHALALDLLPAGLRTQL
jgi:tetratricopeptide (TPR) repeat protein